MKQPEVDTKYNTVQPVHSDQIAQLENTVQALIDKMDALEIRSRRYFRNDYQRGN